MKLIIGLELIVIGLIVADPRANVALYGTTVGPNFARPSNEATKGRCPWSHPYAFSRGKKCCKTPWKFKSGSHEDCDGFKIGLWSECCPEELSMDCPEESCFNYLYNLFFAWNRNNDATSHLTRLLDLDNQCTKAMPDVSIKNWGYNDAIWYKDRIRLCGGRMAINGGSPTQSQCRALNPDTNEWEFMPREWV